MILVICANPALDRLLVLPKLRLNEVNRTSVVEVTPGGKGINVARAIATVGEQEELFLFTGGSTGVTIGEELEKEKISFLTWPVMGETRITTIIHETTGHRHTVINESGPLVSLESALDCIRYITDRINPGDYLVCSGSLPRGMRRDSYALLVEGVKRKGAFPVVDSSGEPFRRAFQASPFMIKPNAREAEEALGFAIRSRNDKIKAVRCFMQRDIPLVVLSDGPRGLVVGQGGDILTVTVDGDFHSGGFAIGSGDTLVGVTVAMLAQHQSLESALRFGTACGLA
ncbi:MAG: hexose kinase, partial [Candidatus Atribacteria bacterium]|nr:hexose kinase [Candidatus Atribacteria bacterium]